MDVRLWLQGSMFAEGAVHAVVDAALFGDLDTNYKVRGPCPAVPHAV